MTTFEKLVLKARARIPPSMSRENRYSAAERRKGLHFTDHEVRFIVFAVIQAPPAGGEKGVRKKILAKFEKIDRRFGNRVHV
jgi:hypothetical protein